MKAEFIGVGEHWSFTEAPYENLRAFEQELSLLDVEIANKQMVDGDCSALFFALRNTVERSDIIFIVGGLGLGSKRITHKVLCGGLTLEMQQSAEALQSARAYFEGQNAPVPDYIDRYGKLPEGCVALPNSNGPHCGMVLARKTQCIISLPEDPDELFPMLLGSVLPYLAGFVEKKLSCQSFVVWDSGPTEIKEALQIPADADYTAAVYRVGQEPARHLVRVAIRENPSDTRTETPETLLQTLKARLQGFAIEEEEQPILQTVIGLLLQKQLKIAIAEYGTEHVLGDAIGALPNATGLYTYDLNECRSQVREKVFGLSDQSLSGLEAYATEASAYMARNVREIDNITFGLAVYKQTDHGCALTVTDGNVILSFEDVVQEELPTAAALLLYRFSKAYPAPPHEATPLEAIVGKNAPNPRMEKLKVFWGKIKKG